MTNKELRTAILEKMKTAGIARKSFSLRVRDCGYSTSAHIDIKDFSTTPRKVQALLSCYSEQRRDMRGEPLDGCNTYIIVQYDYYMLSDAQSAFMGQSKAIIEKSIEIGSGYKVMEHENGNRLYFMCGGKNSVESSLVIFPKGEDSSSYELGQYSAYNEYILAQGLAVFSATGRLD